MDKLEFLCVNFVEKIQRNLRLSEIIWEFTRRDHLPGIQARPTFNPEMTVYTSVLQTWGQRRNGAQHAPCESSWHPWCVDWGGRRSAGTRLQWSPGCGALRLLFSSFPSCLLHLHPLSWLSQNRKPSCNCTGLDKERAVRSGVASAKIRHTSWALYTLDKQPKGIRE